MNPIETLKNGVLSSNNIDTIYVVSPVKDVSVYKNLIYPLYSEEFFVSSKNDVKADGDVYELHEIVCDRFNIVIDNCIGFISITRSNSCVREARIDAALYPEFVGKGYMRKFMTSISNIAKASGFDILMATTSMKRKYSMERCGYKFIEECEEDRGYFEYYVE